MLPKIRFEANPADRHDKKTPSRQWATTRSPATGPTSRHRLEFCENHNRGSAQLHGFTGAHLISEPQPSACSSIVTSSPTRNEGKASEQPASQRAAAASSPDTTPDYFDADGERLLSTASYARARRGDPSDLLWEDEEHSGEDPKVVVTTVHVDFTLDNLGAPVAADRDIGRAQRTNWAWTRGSLTLIGIRLTVLNENFNASTAMLRCSSWRSCSPFC